MPPIRRPGRRPVSNSGGARPTASTTTPVADAPRPPARPGRADAFSGPGPAVPPVAPRSDRVESTRPTVPAGPLPATELAGFRLQGLDLSTVQSGELEITLPLRKGTFLVPTTHADAKARVAEKGSVKVHLQVERGPDGELRARAIDLRFEPRVTVLNPAASLQPATGPLAGLWNWVQDAAGDVHLDAVHVRADGTMHVDGTVDRPFPLGDQSLDGQIPKGTFPRLDLSVKSIAAGHAIAEPAVPSGPPGKDVDLGALLRSLGAMTDQGTFALSVRGKDTALSADLDGLHLRSSKAPLLVDIGGQVELDDTGTLRLTLPSDADAEVRSGAGQADLAGSAAVRLGAGGKLDAEGELRATARLENVTGYVVHDPGITVPLCLSGADNVVVGSTRVRFDGDALTLEQGEATARIHTALDQGMTVDLEDASVRLPKGEAVTDAGFRFGVRGGALVVNDGRADITITGANPEVVARGVRLRVAGDAEVKIHGERIRLDAGAARPSGEGTIRVEVRDGQRPGDAPRVADLGYRLEGDGTLVVRPGAAGVNELVLPLDAVHRLSDKVVDPRGPAAGPVGSAAFQERLTALTGAKVTDGNAVKLLPTGTASRAERLALVNQATTSIDVQTFIYKDDACGREFTDALVAAAKRGVKVRVIVDGLGAVEKAQDLIDEKPFYRRLRDAGVELAVHGDPRTSPVGELFREAATNPELGGVDDLERVMSNPADAVLVLRRLVDTASGKRPASPETRARVTALLEKASTAPGSTTPGISAARLAEIAAGDAVRMNELLLTARQLSELNYRWHEKYLVVDGGAAITGGMNIADEYLFGGSGTPYTRGRELKEAWHDADVRLDGPSANDVAETFGKNWKQLTGKTSPAVPAAPALASGKKVQFVRQDPRADGDPRIANVMVETLKALAPGEKAHIASAYFLTSGTLEGLKTALIDAARRGVDVRIVTNSAKSTDMPQLNRAALYHYEELLEAGVHLYERKGESTLHTKAAAFGDTLATVGSWNTDNRSATLNSESVALVYDADTCREVAEMVSAEMRPDAATELDVATVRQRIKTAGAGNSVLALFDDLM